MVKIIGIGPGSPKYLTAYARELIISSENVIAFERIGRDLKNLNPHIKIVKKVDQAINLLKETKQGILLASGDALFFGIGELIISKGISVDEIIPGITSVQYLFSKLQKSYSKVQTKSIHGRDLDFSSLDTDTTYAFLIDKDRGPNYISRELKKLGHKGILTVGYDLSYDKEKIIEFQIGESIEESSDLGVVVVDFENNSRP